MAESKEIAIDWSENGGKLVRSALGKVAYIGELYDARTEMFCSRSLFTSSFPKNLIKTQQNSKSEMKYSYEDKLSDRFNLLNVEAELQLSILLGLISLQGHGKYLSEEKGSERIVSCSLFYNVSTACEKLMAAFSEIEEFIDKEVFYDEQYTHLVAEINWGANCTVTLEHHYKDSNQKTEAEGMLKGELQKLSWLIKAEGQGGGSYKDTEVTKSNSMNLKVYADVLPDEGIPNTMEKAIDFISKLPELLKSVNQGKGNPLNYIMIPLTTFKKLYKLDGAIATMIKSVDESFIIQIVYFFEELAILKQKLNDLVSDFSSYEKYLPSDCLSGIRKMQQSLKENEAALKTDLALDLPKVRAGKLKIRDLIKKTERHKSTGLNLYKIEDFIDELIPVKSKIDNIKFLTSKNIIYSGKEDDLDFYMNKSIYDDFFVMYTSNELKEKDSDLSRKTNNFFLGAAEKPGENERYVIVDFDFTKRLSSDVNEVKIVHYKGGRVISHDVYKDYEAESKMNFVKLAIPSEMINVQYKPNNRVPLELQCPGFRIGTCSKDPLIWTCKVCKDNLEYGFDNFFYCSCGKALSQSYELKCSTLKHGNKYLPVNVNYPLKEELSKLRPLKEMNILILGQSGVGKSTWVNSIINYLQYDTLEEATKGGVECAIPARFTFSFVTPKTVEKVIVKIGKNDKNEVTSVGKSATQGPKTYNFILNDRSVRLIDTPGLGDTDGIDKDKENMKKILDHISYLREIHGICILMKANKTRIDVLFRFCIMELLTHLHKNAARNILFCFTNARSSFYSPGETSAVLDNLLRELNLNDMITLCGKTMFCLDNEAFRFLCTLKYPEIPHTKDDRKIYEGSWTKSVAETKRLFQQIKELEPHTVVDTTTLCDARSRILNLTKPIAEIAQTIQLNLAAIADEERKINNSKLSLDELAKKLYFPRIELQSDPLDYPRTVCTSSSCVKYLKLKNTDTNVTEYVQICHEHCYLTGITTDSYPQSDLRDCYAIRNGSTCRFCGCIWEKHMHITYTQKRVERSVVDSDVEKEINHKKDSKARIEAHKRQLEVTIEKYRAEEKIIMQTCSQFGVFLKENAIAPYNDSFKEYLEYLIEQEKSKVEKTKVDNDLLKNLNEMMLRYKKEVNILESNMKNTPGTKSLTPRDIKQLESKLYTLELTGQQIKKNVEMSIASNKNAQKYAEQPLPVKKQKLFWFF